MFRKAFIDCAMAQTTTIAEGEEFLSIGSAVKDFDGNHVVPQLSLTKEACIKSRRRLRVRPKTRITSFWREVQKNSLKGLLQIV